MKRELFVHFAFWFLFFVLISIFRHFMSLSFWPFWVGGAIGTLLADVDHLIYIFFLNPQELTSQRVNFLVKKKEVSRAASLLYETRSERKNLVFHTFLFQIIFLVVTFFIVTSSASLFVNGIVLAFSLHLLVDELADFLEMGSLSNWGQLLPHGLDKRKSMLYISFVFFLVCIMGFFM
jgi:hypothetical protein